MNDRNGALADIANGIQRANDNGYQSTETTGLYMVLALVEVARALNALVDTKVRTQ